MFLCFFLLSVIIARGAGDVPTLYEHYTAGGITSGLEALPGGFKLNNRNITIFSGAIHYFRVHPAYWRDRLRKLRACGLNTVETYVPWNLHNPEPGLYDFGNGSTDMTEFLDIRKFIKLAQEEDLFVLVRPGPYICAEWEFGGLPSWLLRDPEMKVRTSYAGYTKAVRDYYNRLMPLLQDLQFVNGGPIIALQIENEYGSFDVWDKVYLNLLKNLMNDNGITSMFYTSDSPTASGDRGALPGVLMTANFQTDAQSQLTTLHNLQPDKPLMVMEYWTGWFDHWTENHHTRSVKDYSTVLEEIITFPASVNLYMFHGGTNWGFLNGANVQKSFPSYQPDVTSYDYDAPLSESGDYAPKYNATKELVTRYNPVVTKLPQPPAESRKVAYANTPFSGQLSLDDLVSKVDLNDIVQSEQVMPMELLPINNGAGQSFGFILYRKNAVTVTEASTLQVKGYIKDVAVVLLDGVRKSEVLTKKDQFKEFGYWEKKDASMLLQNSPADGRRLDILVENWGRNNFGYSIDFHQRKGILSGPVLLDGNELKNWQIVPLQFKKSWLNSLDEWQNVSDETIQSPTLFRAQVQVDEPHDTFIDMTGWGKGVVFVNGFTLGRYFHLGPASTLYLPGPLLHQGLNDILVFELYYAGPQIVFRDSPNLG
ncbi:beta-galactosidase-1-like protein 2 isoform X2 [Anabrus simplex]|uniref:beta-galactosidase-1-like protein 2 isoform X2 n=1 Tax=Anabrus simplex TaxID=316456 RepID=UPI0035A3CAEE